MTYLKNQYWILKDSIMNFLFGEYICDWCHKRFHNDKGFHSVGSFLGYCSKCYEETGKKEGRLK